MRNAAGQPLGGTKLDWTGMSAGGWVSGVDIADDGTLVCRTDTTYGYVRGPNADTWTSLVRVGDSVPESHVDALRTIGVSYSVAIAPSNSNIILHTSGGMVYKSSDKGVTSVRLASFKGGVPDPTFIYDTNIGWFRQGGQHMRIDPANPDVVLMGHPIDGLYRTTNGGTSFGLHPDIPAPTHAGVIDVANLAAIPSGGAATAIYRTLDTGFYWTRPANPVRLNSTAGISIAFDRSSAVVGGQTQGVVVHVAGYGIYRSTTGVSGAFVLVPGGPLTVGGIAAANGRIFACGNGMSNGDTDNTQLFVWSAGSWAQPQIAGTPVSGYSVAVKPGTDTVICLTSNGHYRASTDAGVTWTEFSTPEAPKLYADDLPWLEWTLSGAVALASCCWHPTLNRFYATMGIGFIFMDNPPVAPGVPAGKWYSASRGIQQLLVQSVTVTPSGRIHVPVQDRVCFSLDRDTCHLGVGRHAPDQTTHIVHGTIADYAIDDENFVVLVHVGSGLNTMHISTDGGRSNWSPVQTRPTYVDPNDSSIQPFLGGNVAVGNKNNIVWVSNNPGGVAATLDGGQTWVASNFGGVSMAGVRWINAYIFRRRILVADKANPGTFYLYCIGFDPNNPGNSTSLPQVGLWKSTDGGLNFVRIRASVFGTAVTDFWHSKLRLVPGRPGHLFFACGDDFEDRFWFSSNEGVNDISLSGWGVVQDVAIGKGLGGASYPAIYVVGWRGGQHGLYRCLDFNPANGSGTWDNLVHWPLGELDSVFTTLGADMGKFGRVYYGLGKGGVIYGDYDYKMVLS